MHRTFDWAAPFREIGYFVNTMLGGAADTRDVSATVHRGPAFMLVQTLAFVALAAVLAAVKIAFLGGERLVGWAAVVIPLAMPLLMGVYGRPRRWQLGLLLAVWSGVLVGVLTYVATAAVVAEFWLAFVSASAGALGAGVVFGIVTSPVAGD